MTIDAPMDHGGNTVAANPSPRLALGFACVGHTYAHLFQPIFFIVVLSLEQDMALSHGQAVALIFVGSVLYGVAAPLAGWLGDRWSATGMMTVYFFGTGAAMALTGLAETPFEIGAALTVVGLFASIYHPVGIAWVVRSSVNTGTALGVNGIFGGLGPAVAALMTGAIIDSVGWRAAFVLPGVVVAATGAVFAFCLWRRWVVENKIDMKPPPPPATRADTIRVYLVLAFTMSCSGIIYSAVQPALPKAFALDFTDGGGVLGVSALVALVYTISGLMQLVGGRLADYFPARRVYLYTYVLQLPVLFLAGMVSGSPLVMVAIVMLSLNASSLPAENVLIARYTPPHRRALVYGLKFVVAIGIANLGILLEGGIYDATGGFYWLYVTLTVVGAVAVAAILMLPPERATVAEPVPAE